MAMLGYYNPKRQPGQQLFTENTDKVYLEVKQLFKLLIQGDTQNQGQLCSGAELSGFDGADGVSGWDILRIQHSKEVFGFIANRLKNSSPIVGKNIRQSSENDC